MKDRESELEEMGGGIVKVRKKVKRSEDSEQIMKERRGDQEQEQEVIIGKVEITEKSGKMDSETDNVSKGVKKSKATEVENFDLQIQNVVISEIEVIESEESRKVVLTISFSRFYKISNQRLIFVDLTLVNFSK